MCSKQNKEALKETTTIERNMWKTTKEKLTVNIAFDSPGQEIVYQQIKLKLKTSTLVKHIKMLLVVQ